MAQGEEDEEDKPGGEVDRNANARNLEQLINKSQRIQIQKENPDPYSGAG